MQEGKRKGKRVKEYLFMCLVFGVSILQAKTVDWAHSNFGMVGIEKLGQLRCRGGLDVIIRIFIGCGRFRHKHRGNSVIVPINVVRTIWVCRCGKSNYAPEGAAGFWESQ